MKVLMGVHHYPPDYVAGVELGTQRTAEWLIAQDHSVEIICVTSTNAEAHPTVRIDRQDGAVIYRLGLNLDRERASLGLRFRDEALGRWLADHIRRSRPDLYFAQSSYLLSASTIEAARECGVPVLVMLHDYWFMCPRITLLKPSGERCVKRATPGDCAWCLMTERRRYQLVDKVVAKLGRRSVGRRGLGVLSRLLQSSLVAKLDERQVYLEEVLRSADQLVTCSRLAKELLIVRGFSADDIQHVPHGLDYSRWSGLPHLPRDGTLRLGYLGQLAPPKGVEVLIEAFRRLPKSANQLELRIYGDTTRLPRYVARLKELARCDPRIRFFGGYDNDRVEAVLAGIDLLVVPSLWFETGPRVVVEAFAAGVPVVASRLPNMQYEIRDEVDGLLFAPNNVADLARQLRRFLEEPGLTMRLATNIKPVRALETEMRELGEICRLLAGRARVSGQTD